MTVLLATATAGHPLAGLLALILAGLVLAIGYVIACAIWPFRACPRCTGSGKRRSPSGRAWRPCRRCRGTGGRLRFGRRIWNFAQAKRRAAE